MAKTGGRIFPLGIGRQLRLPDFAGRRYFWNGLRKTVRAAEPSTVKRIYIPRSCRGTVSVSGACTEKFFHSKFFKEKNI